MLAAATQAETHLLCLFSWVSKNHTCSLHVQISILAFNSVSKEEALTLTVL